MLKIFRSNSIFYALVAGAFLLQIISALGIQGYYYSDEFSSFLEKPFQWLNPDFVHYRNLEKVSAYRSLYLQWWHYFLLNQYSLFATYSAGSALAFLKSVASIIWLGGLFFWYRLAKVYLPLVAARITVLVFAYWYYSVYFANRLLSENYSLVFVAAAFYFLVKHEKFATQSHRQILGNLLISGGLFALASQLRLQIAFFCVGPFVYFVAKRNWAALLAFCLGFWLTFCAFGLAEYGMRGEVFATLRNYYQINIVDRAITINASPWYAYLGTLNFQFSEWFFPFFLLFAARGAAVSPILGISAVAFIAFHMLFPHKEVSYFTLNRDVAMYTNYDIRLDNPLSLQKPEENAYVLVASERIEKVSSWLDHHHRRGNLVKEDEGLALIRVESSE